MTAELKPSAVLAEFTRLTGIKFRVLPDSVARQAGKFVAAGFTLAELELVIAWTKRQIATVRNWGPESLQWRVLFGDHGAADEFVKFQERLGLAEEAQRRGWRPKLGNVPAVTKPAPAAATVVSAPAVDADRIAAAAREQAAAFRRQMGRDS
jgi:hypothetical protein